MQSPWHRTIIRISGLGFLYAATILVGTYLVQPSVVSGLWQSGRPISRAVTVAQAPMPSQPSETEAKPRFFGKPIRIVIPDYNIDLAVEDGRYDPATNSWDLADDHAMFAVITTPANTETGNTFIYGHGTGAVFGALGEKTPAVGTKALLHTDTNHVFEYAFANRSDLLPTDMSIFDYAGPPVLTVQTCTGVFSEWRSMFRFTLNGVLD